MRKSPNSKRERLRLNPKSKPEVQQESALVRDERGHLVFTGKPIGVIDWDRLIDEDREARIRKIGGW